MKLQSLPTFLVRRKNWLLMAALALSPDGRAAMS